MARLIPESLKDWENAGISLAAVIEALVQLEVHKQVGLTDAQLPHVLVLVFAVAAIVRKCWAKRKKGESNGTATGSTGE